MTFAAQERGVPPVARILPVVMLVSAVVAWELAARAGWVSVLFFPPPSRMLGALFGMGGTGEFWLSLGTTLFRVGMGLLLGGGAGLLLGWLMGTVRALRAALDPIVATLHPLPKVAIFPIFLILLGIGEWSRIAPVALAAFFPMLLNTLSGVRQIDRVFWEVAVSYGAGGRALLRRVILPGSLPMVLTGFRLAVNDALVVTIAIEMLSADRGLGATIWMAWQTLRTEDLYATLIVIAALGVLNNALLRLLVRMLLPWHREYSTD